MLISNFVSFQTFAFLNLPLNYFLFVPSTFDQWTFSEYWLVHQAFGLIKTYYKKTLLRNLSFISFTTCFAIRLSSIYRFSEKFRNSFGFRKTLTLQDDPNQVCDLARCILSTVVVLKRSQLVLPRSCWSGPQTNELLYTWIAH